MQLVPVNIHAGKMQRRHTLRHGLPVAVPAAQRGNCKSCRRKRCLDKSNTDGVWANLNPDGIVTDSRKAGSIPHGGHKVDSLSCGGTHVVGVQCMAVKDDLTKQW